MRVDDLVAKLQEVKQSHGNIEIKVYSFDDQMNPSDLKEINISKERIIGWDHSNQSWITVECEPYVAITD